MKRRLCIGIQKRTTAWDAVLNNLGVHYEVVDYSKALAENYSTIILNNELNTTQVKACEAYLNASGSILEIAENLLFTEKDSTYSSSSKTLIRNSDHQGFQHIPFVDLFDDVKLHNSSTLFEGLVHFDKYSNGSVGFFGVDISDLIQKEEYRRKRFYSEIGDFPDEIVSTVSKHELIQVFLSTLKELHYQQGIPFISKWTSPSKQSVFGFRIDSDYADKKSIDNLYSVLKKNDVQGTWFLHVEAHQEWLNHFHSFENQEIALHGYKHGVSKSETKVQRNIRTGMKYLNEAGFSYDGFCGPYGIWNKALKKILSGSPFSYSSEFTFAYDGFPIQPVGENLPLQIPIHPICTGSLSRKRYSSEEMKKYFRQIIDKKAGRYEPVFFYHHPLQPGLEVLDFIFKSVNHQNLNRVTFSEFTKFWKSRSQFKFEAWFTEDEIFLEKSSDPEMLLNLSSNHHSFELLKAKNDNIDIPKTSKFKYSNSYLPEKQQIEQLSNQDLRLLKTSLLDWKNRNRL